MAESAAPYREFIREVVLRIERVSREETRRAEINHREVMAEIREFREEYRADMEEVHAENRAQRSALLAMIDRLQGNGPEPAT